jgi:hypothetical protein
VVGVAVVAALAAVEAGAAQEALTDESCPAGLMSQNRALGLGLIGLGVVLGGVMLLWLLVTLLAGETSPGGAVLGLLLAAVLGLPLIGGGLYVLSRGKLEEAETADFRTQRRTFEGDRMFRAEQARELEQLARRVEGVSQAHAGPLATRLRDLVHDLEEPAYNEASWYEAVQLGRADLDALQRYEDLLSERARLMHELAGRLENGEAVLPELRESIEAWERDLSQRAALLVGRPVPGVAPGDLLSAEPEATASETLARLKIGDAVSRDGTDYLVETSVSYFSSGRTWWLHRLTSERDEAWLYVSPGGLSLAWLKSAEVAREPGASSLVHEDSACRLEESTDAAADVRTRGGPRSGGTVMTWRYECDDGHLLWLERWPERIVSYSGWPLRPSDLEIWPAEAAQHGTGS